MLSRIEPLGAEVGMIASGPATPERLDADNRARASAVWCVGFIKLIWNDSRAG